MANLPGNKNQSGFLVRLRFTVKFQYKMAKITGNKTNRVFSHVYVFCGQGIIMGTKSCKRKRSKAADSFASPAKK